MVLFGSDAVLDLLNAPAAVAQLAGPYLQMLALALLLEAFNPDDGRDVARAPACPETLIAMVMHGVQLLLAFVLMRGIGSWTAWA